MNILLTLAYNGAAYHGFQVQQNAVSVCKVLQDAMQNLFKARPDVKGCSRTDAGVHAWQFYVNFHHDTAIPMEKVPLALNYYLPADIRVLAAQQVPEDFHARYSALSKRYRFVILNTNVDDPFVLGQYVKINTPLKVEAMQEAARFLLGKHDFVAFMSAGSTIKDTVRTVMDLQVRRDGDWIYIEIEADGFLYNMVRIISGTLVQVGQGRMPIMAVPAVLAGGKRQAAGETLAPEGLFLLRVNYQPGTVLGQNERESDG